MPRVNIANVGNVIGSMFKWAKIQTIQSLVDTAKIEICDKNWQGTGEIIENVPIFFHCKHDVVQRSNGALEGGSSAFAIGDKVVVRFNTDNEPMIMIRYDGLKPCSNAFWLFGTDNKIFDFENSAAPPVYIKDKIFDSSFFSFFPIFTTGDKTSAAAISSYSFEDDARIISCFKFRSTYDERVGNSLEIGKIEKIMIKVFDKNTANIITKTIIQTGVGGCSYSINSDGFNLVSVINDSNAPFFQYYRYDFAGNILSSKSASITDFTPIVEYAPILSIATQDNQVYFGGYQINSGIPSWLTVKPRSIFDYDPTLPGIVEKTDIVYDNNIDSSDDRTLDYVNIWPKYVTGQIIIEKGWNIDKYFDTYRVLDFSYSDVWTLNKASTASPTRYDYVTTYTLENGEPANIDNYWSGLAHADISYSNKFIRLYRGIYTASTSTVWRPAPLYYYDFSAAKWRWFVIGTNQAGDAIYTSEDGIVADLWANPHHHYYRSFVLYQKASNIENYDQNCITAGDDSIETFTSSVNWTEQAKIRIGAPNLIINDF